MFFGKRGHQVFEHRKTEHGGRGGEQEQVTMSCLGTAVYFSSVIDRQSVSVVIVRRLCDVWRKMKSVTFVTDEQNVLSLCPGERPTNLVTVRIRCLSVQRIQPHMYPRSSAPSHVWSFVYYQSIKRELKIRCINECRCDARLETLS